MFWKKKAKRAKSSARPGAIRAAVVGAGHLGRYHADKYAKIEDAELIAVVDINERACERVARKTKSSALTDYKKLPELGVQCASIASDTSTHFEIASWLLQNGVDVLVEKPITTTVEEAEQLIQIAKANGRILQAGHLERFNPAFQSVKKVLTNPAFFEVRRIAPFTGRGADVDVVLDLMIHDIDIVAHLVGRPLLKIDAVGVPVVTSTTDIASARLTFEGGAVANVTASRAAIKSERSIRMFQPDVYISLDFGKKRVKIYTNAGERTENGIPKISTEEHQVEERDALEDQIRAFVNSVEHRTPPIVDGEDGKRALELVEQIQNAMKEHAKLLDGGLTSQSALLQEVVQGT